MKIGFIGLGRMGMNMVIRLLDDNHEVVAYNRTYAKTQQVADKGAIPCKSIAELVTQLPSPKIVWLMLPAGEPTENHLIQVADLLAEGDIVIDGGNACYKDSIRHAAFLNKKKLHFLDIGVSGGIWGLEKGYCMMAGGEEKIFKKVEPILKTLAPKDGYAYMGGHGSGHFVKMVHNGIEYAMLQAYAEGFEVLQAKKEFSLNLEKIANLWNHSSVIQSWLLELSIRAFHDDPHLDSIAGYVDDSGEGRWTVKEAIDLDVPAPAITLSLLERFRSRQKESFAAKVIAALRNQFGGHAVKKEQGGKRGEEQND
jgi:6-phosphogluconate dehydrogenase